MDILAGFNGILQVDGYAGYDALAEPRRVGGTPLTLAYCRAHARRKLHDIHQKDGSKIAAEGLRRIARIYKIEASMRGHAPEDRLAIRQAQSAPRIADLRKWLTNQRSVVRGNDPPDRFLILTTSTKSVRQENRFASQLIPPDQLLLLAPERFSDPPHWAKSSAISTATGTGCRSS